MTEDQHIARAAAALDDPGVRREATAPRAVDPLREALADMDRCDEWACFSFDEVKSRARAALAAAPPPAPVDQKALVELIYRAGKVVDYTRAESIADALIAAGLRLPGAQPAETLAWGIIRKDGEIIAGGLRSREIVERGLRDGERIARVAIRRVEDEA